jgi:hypothetical protein
MLRFNRSGFDKKHTRTRYAELVLLHLVGSVGHVVHTVTSRARNVDTLFFRLVWALCGFPQIVRYDTLHQTCIFAYC